MGSGVRSKDAVPGCHDFALFDPPYIALHGDFQQWFAC